MMLLTLFLVMNVALGTSSQSSEVFNKQPMRKRRKINFALSCAGSARIAGAMEEEKTAEIPTLPAEDQEIRQKKKTGLRIANVTWNLANGDALEANLKYWINPVIEGKIKPDVFVIALQESKQNVKVFKKMVETHIASSGFICVCAEALGIIGNIKILIFVKQEYAVDITSSIETNKVSRGKCGTSYKGGCIVTFEYQGMRYTFVAAHLCAGQKEKSLEKREADAAAILAEVMKTQSNYVIFMGDLNYRLDYRDQGMENKHVLSKKNKDDVTHKTRTHLNIWKGIMTRIELFRKGLSHLKVLLDHDELKKKLQVEESPWYGFQEGEVNFLPSYCVEQTEGVHYNPTRFPSWCDRVLYKCNNAGGIKCVDYGMFPEPSEGDHKPVYAVLDCVH